MTSPRTGSASLGSRRPPRTTKGRLAPLLGWCLLAAAAGCTDADLRGIPKPDNLIDLAGEFCTGAPIDTVRSLKVLFLVDSSSSMRWNDPDDLLVDALEHLTARYASQPSISFAIVRWGSTRVVRENLDYAPSGTDPPMFTNDPATLAAIYARMRQPSTVNPLKYLDGTNFLLALTAANDYIVGDVAQNPSETLTSRYLVEFITDGMPQSATDDPAITRRNILAAVENLRTRYDAKVDVTSIAQDVVAPPEFFNLLPDMAKAGGGTYTQLSSPAALDAVFDATLSHSSNLVDYELGSYFAFNPHLRLTTFEGKLDLYLDSDGDGLLDVEEAKLGTSPQEVDTDGDGLDDLFEVRMQASFDPTARNFYDQGVDGAEDPDGDRLSNFEERSLGTDPYSPDTDRDGVPDDIELMVGTDPLTADATADPDGDLVPTGDEIFEHTDPFGSESGALRESSAYRIDPPVELSRSHGVRCYSFGVANVALARSLASNDLVGRARPAGFNELEVVVLATALHGSATTGSASDKSFPVRLFRARRYVVLGERGHRDPPALEIHLQSNEFFP